MRYLTRWRRKRQLMWLTTDRPIDEMDTAKLREIVNLSDYYPPHVVENARDELLKRETYPAKGNP